ncbi:hypothetical protein [Longimicrobium sp.]|jgi:peptidoglycan/LPS O-acetylase OafA/YrhL|uniref:hypothetical protein n=1 Tax=Longimicrobium sp. TaxID=2029185 RepID=UPI002ED8767D
MLLTRIRRVRAALLICAALLAEPGALDAQTSVAPGTRVRILAPSLADTLIAGTVIEIDSASMLLAPWGPGGVRTVTLRDIDRLEVRGPASMTASVLRWMVAGAVAGYAVCHAASGSPHANCPRAGGAAAGGTMGVMLGLAIGSRSRGAGRWRPVPVPGRAGP